MAKGKQTKAYGLWPSRIAPELTGNLLEFSELAWNDDGCLFWRERSSNQAYLQMWDPGTDEIKKLSGDLNIGGGLMYGGGSFTVRGEKIVVVEKGTNQLHLLSLVGDSPIKLNLPLKKTASPIISPDGNTLAFAHSTGEIDNVKTIKFESNYSQKLLLSGADFYNYLRWHPDGTHLVWISWNNPYMPWDSSQLFLGKIDNEQEKHPTIDEVLHIVGWEGNSILQPEFSPDGQHLAFISDQDGWWQLYLHSLISGELNQLTCAEADHGLPPWLQNQCSYGFNPDSKRIYFIRNQLGFASLWEIELTSRVERKITLNEEYTWLESLSVSPRDDKIALVASGGRIPAEIIVANSAGDYQVIRQSSEEILPVDLFSPPEPISIDVGEIRDENLEYVEEGEVPLLIMVHGLFYKPQNPDYDGKGKPPLLIIVHSGPTRQKYAEFQPRTQYFTSRGFAVFEINYHGSTGYGREYWEILKHRWGSIDPQGVQRSAKKLIELNLIDPERIVVMGSSSGGYTVYNLLDQYPGTFKAAVVLYGVSDPISSSKTQVKFERYYNDWLLGLYDYDLESPSPLFLDWKINDPVILFQGGNDPVVPKEQAELIVDQLRKNNIPHEYHLYPEEGHGFKKSENVKDFYQKTEAFLKKHVLD
jgi:dipeptidyl aminopeptidase/acylaminoacyl peptidase